MEQPARGFNGRLVAAAEPDVMCGKEYEISEDEMSNINEENGSCLCGAASIKATKVNTNVGAIAVFVENGATAH